MGIESSIVAAYEPFDADAVREVLVARRVQLAAGASPAGEDIHTENELAEFAHCLIQGKIEQFTTPWVAKEVQEFLDGCTQDATETKALAEAAALLIAEISRRKRLAHGAIPA